MSLSVYLEVPSVENIYSDGITHNLNKMARAVKLDEHTLYEYLWHPEDIDIRYARELIKPLEIGLKELKSKPEHYEQFDPPNGWGSYENLVPFVEKYLNACKENPNAKVFVWI